MEKRIENHLKKGITKGFSVLFHILFGVAFVALFGYVAMLLWNWLIPDITGWSFLNYWQTLGLFALCRLFFGKLNFKAHHRHHHRKKHFHQKWEKMSPQQREEFMKSCCTFTFDRGDKKEE